MPRGDRFARHQPLSRDEQGRSLPSDESMRYVALVLVCKQHPEGERPELARFWIQSHHADFVPAQVNEGTNSAVIQREPRQLTDGTEYIRYKMKCPKCSNAPVFTSLTLDRALAATYEHGAVAKEVRHPI